MSGTSGAAMKHFHTYADVKSLASHGDNLSPPLRVLPAHSVHACSGLNLDYAGPWTVELGSSARRSFSGRSGARTRIHPAHVPSDALFHRGWQDGERMTCNGLMSYTR